MNYSNIPEQLPKNVYHKTFFSALAGHDIGYNIYLPSNYETSAKNYAVQYHLHGWQGNESSEVEVMEKVYGSGDVITVFPNLSISDDPAFPFESMITDELIHHIDSEYRTIDSRDARSISGFSMGGGMAFIFAMKHTELFSKVTAYAGTFHHYFEHGMETVGADHKKAVDLHDYILSSVKRPEFNVLTLLNKYALSIRDNLEIEMRVGTDDVLYCDNEIVHYHLNLLQIPHKYLTFEGVSHLLRGIV